LGVAIGLILKTRDATEEHAAPFRDGGFGVFFGLGVGLAPAVVGVGVAGFLVAWSKIEAATSCA